MSKKALRIAASALSLLLLLSAAVVLSGCNTSRMPYNGKISFHDITAEIPSDFVRDSTKSNDDLWVFEKGGYREYILLSRSDAAEDVIAQLDDYVELMRERGAESSRGEYLCTDAVLSKYYKEGEYCQEIAFHYNGSLYAFALRCGTDEEFQSLMNKINTPETTPMD